MVYGELGIQPLESQIKSRMIGYWGKLVTFSPDKFCFLMYTVSWGKEYTSKWNNKVQDILNETGFGYLWQQTNAGSLTIGKIQEIKQRISDQCLQKLKSNDSCSTKKTQYLLLKEDWKIEKYLENLDYSHAITLLKFRLDNHKLPVEIGRYQKIDYKDRICPKCRTEIGDKFHYIFSCPSFTTERQKFIPHRFRNRSNIYKYKDLLNHSNTKVLNNLCRFIKLILAKVK